VIHCQSNAFLRSKKTAQDISFFIEVLKNIFLQYKSVMARDMEWLLRKLYCYRLNKLFFVK